MIPYAPKTLGIVTGTVVGLLLTGVAGATPRYLGQGERLADAVEAWMYGDEAGGLALFEEAFEADRDDIDGLVWLAEALRVTGDLDRSTVIVRAALERDPDHAFAHTVRGDLVNVLHTPSAPRDQLFEALRAYQAALAADPHDLNALLRHAELALLTGGDEQWRGNLRAMRRAEVWPRSVVVYARWVLESCPDDAVLLVDGEVGAYPLWMLQEQGVRSDVIIVHVPYLDASPIYRDRLRERGLEMQSEQELTSPVSGSRWPSQALLGYFLETYTTESSRRALVAAWSVEGLEYPVLLGHLPSVLGGVGRYLDGETGIALESDALEATFDEVSADVLAGPWVFEGERSVRRATEAREIALLPAKVALQCYGYAVTDLDRSLATTTRAIYMSYRERLRSIPHEYQRRFEMLEPVYRSLSSPPGGMGPSSDGDG